MQGANTQKIKDVNLNVSLFLRCIKIIAGAPMITTEIPRTLLELQK